MLQLTHTHVSQSKPRKVLKWFEDIFVLISGEDQLLQLEEFAVVLHTDDVSCLHSVLHGLSMCFFLSMKELQTLGSQHFHIFSVYKYSNTIF